jgi:outer membrane protein
MHQETELMKSYNVFRAFSPFLAIGVAASAALGQQAPASTLASVAGAPSVVAAQAPADPVMTLDEAIDAALKANPGMAQSAGAVRSAQASQKEAQGAFLPRLSLSTSTSFSGTQQYGSSLTLPGSAGGTSQSYGAGISASYDLYTGGRRTAELRQTRAQTSAAQAGLVAEQYDVRLATKQAFFDVLRRQDQVEVAQAQVARAQQELDAAETRVRVGSATASDQLRAQLALNQARQALLEAQSAGKVARFALGRTVGSNGPVGAKATAQDLAVTPVRLDSLAAYVQAQSPALLAAQAGAQASEAGVRAAKSQYLPSLQLTTGYNWDNQQLSVASGQTGWRVGIGLSYPLFDGFSRQAQVQKAQVQADVAHAQLEDARRAATEQFQAAATGVEQAQQRIALAEEAVSVAERDLQVQEQRYRIGGATMLDLVTSQASLAQAQNDRISARYDYQIARAQLEALAGRPL